MSARRSAILVSAAVLLLASGCSRFEGMATRYRTERMAREAQREETKLRIGKAGPDSATMLIIRAGYTRLRATFRPPFLSGSGKDADRIRRDIARQVGAAELTASRIALEAGRPDLALESARWVAFIADADTGLAREADLATALALRGLRRFDEAIAVLRAMIERYPPVPPPSPEREDQILSLPDAIIELRSEMGDSEGVKKEQALAVAYYRRILAQRPPPFLEAQVRARLARTLLEMDDSNAAFAEVAALRRLVSATPELQSLEAELLYTEARIRGMQKNNKAALELYDLVVKNHPTSRFASKALLDAGVIAERMDNREGAVARYRAIVDNPRSDPAIAPVATYRMAMVKDLMGNWVEAKQALEEIPLKYPNSRAAVEAPFAIVEHYARARQPDAAKAALEEAAETFRALIARDTSSVYGAVYRWNLLRAYAALETWKDALATVDQMAEKDRGAPITAEALFQGAHLARMTGDKPRSDIYLQRIVLEYPQSPRAEAIRGLLGRTSRAPGNSAKK